MKTIVQNSETTWSAWHFMMYQHGNAWGKFFGLSGPGQIEVKGQHKNWSSSWSMIVPTRFGEGGKSGLLFFDRSCRRGEFYAVDARCNLSLLDSYDGWRPGWTNIIPGPFGRSRTPGLLFYEQSTGSGEFYGINEKAQLDLVNNYRGWHRGWSHIVPLFFVVKGQRQSLMFYDSGTRQVEIYPLEVDATLEEPPCRFLTTESFSHVIPIASNDPLQAKVLFYSSATGKAEIGTLDYPGKSAGSRILPRWPTGINQIVRCGGQFVFHFDEGVGDRFQMCSDGSQTHDTGERSHDHRFRREIPGSNVEAYYRELLGLNGPITRESLTRAYKEKIPAYHPDKVQHMATEFRALAEERTKELNAARDFFAKRLRQGRQ